MAGSRSHPDWYHNFTQHVYPVVGVHNPGPEHHEVADHEPCHEVEVAGHEVAGHEVAGHEVAGHEVGRIDHRRESGFEAVGQQPYRAASLGGQPFEDDPEFAVEVFDGVDTAHLLPGDQGQVEEARDEVVRRRNWAAEHRHQADCSDASTDLRRLFKERPTKKQYTHTCVCSEREASSEARQVDLQFLNE